MPLPACRASIRRCASTSIPRTWTGHRTWPSALKPAPVSSLMNSYYPEAAVSKRAIAWSTLPWKNAFRKPCSVCWIDQLAAVPAGEASGDLDAMMGELTDLHRDVLETSR